MAMVSTSYEQYRVLHNNQEYYQRLHERQANHRFEIDRDCPFSFSYKYCRSVLDDL